MAPASVASSRASTLPGLLGLYRADRFTIVRRLNRYGSGEERPEDEIWHAWLGMCEEMGIEIPDDVIDAGPPALPRHARAAASRSAAPPPHPLHRPPSHGARSRLTAPLSTSVLASHGSTGQALSGASGSARPRSPDTILPSSHAGSRGCTSRPRRRLRHPSPTRTVVEETNSLTSARITLRRRGRRVPEWASRDLNPEPPD